MHYAGVKNYELLEKLIERISDEGNKWSISDYDACFCGNSNNLTPDGISAIFYGNEHDPEYPIDMSPLIMPDGWQWEEDEEDAVDSNDNLCREKYSRENAIRVLKDIRDKGYYSW